MVIIYSSSFFSFGRSSIYLLFKSANLWYISLQQSGNSVRYLLHRLGSSSELSGQSGRESHSRLREMHVPSLQRNSLAPQSREAVPPCVTTVNTARKNRKRTAWDHEKGETNSLRAEELFLQAYIWRWWMTH